MNPDGIWTIEILGPPPPRPGKGHWSVVHKAKREWTEYIGWLARAKGIPPCVPGERRSVSITFFRPGPESDGDNAAAACKVPLDALKRAGLIEDDSPRHIDFAQPRTVPDPRSRTVIRLARVL